MNLEALASLRLPPVEQRYARRDVILYALGLGYGDRPCDPKHLAFVYEAGLCPVPSLCNVLAHPGFWLMRPDLEIDWIKVLHGEQAFTIESAIPVEGEVRGEYEIVAVEDKGPQIGAVLHVAKRLYDAQSGVRLATVDSVYMLRGDGGRGGFGTPAPAPAPLADSAPDLTVDLPTLPQAALIYRLSGDLNPIHADPEAAAKAGFPRPILHGLCTMGLATRMLVDALAEGDPSRLQALSVRFSKPAFPGETIRLEIFRTDGDVRFRARALERDVIVLDRCTARIAPASIA